MTEVHDWNRQIIEEFRANGGKVGGPFAGAPMLLLTTTGAKSGKHRTTPLVYLPDGERQIIFASKGGAPTNPDWFHNLLAHPQVTIELGNETFEATAVVTEGMERDELYTKQAARMSNFAEYQAKTTRRIPVVALERHK
jgi:deazaflavin-dependent oxidoreductase (nitroreductase family)